MKIIFTQQFLLDNLNIADEAVYMLIDSHVQPIKGDQFVDSVYEPEEYPVIENVAVDYSNNICYVDVNKKSISATSLSQQVSNFKSHGWTEDLSEILSTL